MLQVAGGGKGIAESPIQLFTTGQKGREKGPPPFRYDHRFVAMEKELVKGWKR